MSTATRVGLGRAWRRTLTVAIAVTVALLGLGIVAASAAPEPLGNCTTTSGVILAVDFSHWGGPVLRSCGTAPTTGYLLLNQGGWHTTGTGHDGPAFICRIGYSGYQGGIQYPTAKQDSCVLTPPAAAYWSYWHADPGQHTWSYSQLGAMGYHPKPGSVDLWDFGATNIAGTTGSGVPTINPDTLRAHNTTPTGGGGGGSGGGGSKKAPPKVTVTTPGKAAPRPTQGAGTTAGTTEPGPPGSARSTTSTPCPSASASPPVASPSPSPSRARATPSTTPSPPPSRTPASTPRPSCSSTGHGAGLRVLDAPPFVNTASTHASHGSPTSAIIALVIVVLLGAAGVIGVLRRPRREQ